MILIFLSKPQQTVVHQSRGGPDLFSVNSVSHLSSMSRPNGFLQWHISSPRTLSHPNTPDSSPFKQIRIAPGLQDAWVTALWLKFTQERKCQHFGWKCCVRRYRQRTVRFVSCRNDVPPWTVIHICCHMICELQNAMRIRDVEARLYELQISNGDESANYCRILRRQRCLAGLDS
jgi:hypothetical protein